ncbi:MAG: BON domain-containing protein [Gammaproteobacteria bacterium]|nr:BON domain-containing protein [Gammaproteobacteria bacterium]
MKFKLGSILVLLASLTMLGGCASVGGGGDAAVMNDLLTERSIIRALYQEPDLTGNPILVGCVDGVVTLSGVVDSAVERQLAEQVAKSIDGVSSVNNNLQTSS